MSYTPGTFRKRDHARLLLSSPIFAAVGVTFLCVTGIIWAQQPSGPRAVVRHGISINNGRIEGSVQQLTGEATTLNSGAVIIGDLLVPGTPTLRQNGSPNFGGIIQGAGNTQPSGYMVTLNGDSQLGHLVTRIDPVAIPAVPAPPAATGTRNVTLNNQGQSAGDFAALRDLTLNGNVGLVSVPPGTYRRFTANGGGSGFVLGVAGSSQPATYNLNALALNSGSQLQLAGPVNLTLATGITLNAPMGSSTNPLWLSLKVASGGVTLNSGGSVWGVISAPSGTITINGNSSVVGNVLL
ncbi:MAG: hypothetical protein WKF84_23550 [Pyrinomonadaceae bacterium]